MNMCTSSAAALYPVGPSHSIVLLCPASFLVVHRNSALAPTKQYPHVVPSAASAGVLAKFVCVSSTPIFGPGGRPYCPGMLRNVWGISFGLAGMRNSNAIFKKTHWVNSPLLDEPRLWPEQFYSYRTARATSTSPK